MQLLSLDVATSSSYETKKDTYFNISWPRSNEAEMIFFGSSLSTDCHQQVVERCQKSSVYMTLYMTVHASH